MVGSSIHQFLNCLSLLMALEVDGGGGHLAGKRKADSAESISWRKKTTLKLVNQRKARGDSFPHILASRHKHSNRYIRQSRKLISTLITQAKWRGKNQTVSNPEQHNVVKHINTCRMCL